MLSRSLYACRFRAAAGLCALALLLGSAPFAHADLTGFWTGESNQENGRYGFSVSTAGDLNGDGFSDIAIGAIDYDASASGDGRVFVYYGGATDFDPTPTEIDGGIDELRFGYSVDCAGDVNGDGYHDLVVGTPYYDVGVENRGIAYVFFGSASGVGTTPDQTLVLPAGSSGTGFGVSVAGASGAALRRAFGKRNRPWAANAS